METRFILISIQAFVPRYLQYYPAFVLPENVMYDLLIAWKKN
jgi:hypothetical protein